MGVFVVGPAREREALAVRQRVTRRIATRDALRRFVVIGDAADVTRFAIVAVAGLGAITRVGTLVFALEASPDEAATCPGVNAVKHARVVELEARAST